MCLQCQGRKLVSIGHATETSGLINILYADTDVNTAKRLSSHERKQSSHIIPQSAAAAATAAIVTTTQSLVYGEIEFWSFARILELVQPRHGETFVDLGSGTGKGVLIAATLFPFGKCIGIELLSSLHKIAMLKAQQLASVCKLCTSVVLRDNTTEIELHCADITQQKWNAADIVYMASTAFTDELFDIVATLCNDLPAHCRVITLSKSLPNPQFKVVHSAHYQMSWGPVSVFIHERNRST
jgi:Histone methylation protein DOT1